MVIALTTRWISGAASTTIGTMAITVIHPAFAGSVGQ